MKTILTILGFVVLLAPGTAMADEDCFVPMADWQPRDAVARLAEENGWTVRRIKIDDGCYEIDGRDAAGRRIEVTIQPATLDVIEVEYEDEDEDESEDDDRPRSDRTGGDND
ncbi:PepSY domain-containing protein [Yoonia vestfoldensis]|uniref:PepSY domain-containing protein n=1 Tax=Yoonia vestfoldensis TaxID=245188 RepID=UPI00037D4E1B|nr:PepSY domain-containing protein [Yoonia vestfoldensis]